MPFPAFVGGSLGIGVATLLAASMLRRNSTLSVLAAFAGTMALLLFSGLGYLNLVVDDSYISFRYAQHLADGQGPNWNSTGHVEGYTNFLWVLILAGFAKAGISLVVASRVLDFLAVMGALFATYLIWRLWADEDEEGTLSNPVLVAVVFVLLGLAGGVPFYAFAGLETPVFMALITTSAYLYFLERRGRSRPWSAVTLAAAAMTRPEGVLVAAVTGVFQLYRLRAGAEPKVVRHVLVWAAVLGALYGSYFIWRYTYYDYLLPNTFYAKVSANSSGYSQGLDYLRAIGNQYLLLPMFIAAALLLAYDKLRADVAYVIALCGSLMAATALEGGDFMPFGRFVVPILPLLYLAGVSGFAVVLKRAVARRNQAFFLASGALALTALALVQGSTQGLLPQERLGYREHRAIADWIREYTPSDITVGVFPAGVLGYYSERDVLDMLGINDTTIAHTKVADFGAGVVGHEKYNLDYILDDARPEVLVVLEGQLGPTTKEDIQNAVEHTLLEPRDALLADARLWANYQLQSLVLDELWLNVFFRNDFVSQVHGAGLIDPQNLLANPGTSTDGWKAFQSTLQPSAEGLIVTSDQAAYGPYQSTAAINASPGQTYVAVVWVKGTSASAGDLISLSLRENGQHGSDSESNGFFQLSTIWQPLWVARTVGSTDVRSFSMHVLKLGDSAKPDTLTIRDAQVHRIQD